MSTLTDLEYEVDRYKLEKQLSGRGLDDDPIWVQKFLDIIERDDGS